MSTAERERLIREKLNAMPEMTPMERHLQLVSFAYGNVSVDEPTVTRALVEAAAARRR